MAKVTLSEKLSQFSAHWTPHIVARYNGNEVRVAKLKGAFDWHAHADTDELFLVIKGTLHLHFRDHTEILAPGDLYVVLQVALPPADTEAAKAAYRDMEAALDFNPRDRLQP